MKIEQALFTTMRFNFLYVDRYVFRTGWVYPKSFVPYNMVRYIVKGEALFIIDGTEIRVGENQIIYIPEGCDLTCRTLGDYFEFYSIRFRLTTQMDAGDFLKEYFHIQYVTKAGNDREILQYFQKVYQNATSERASRMFHIRGNLELIIAWLVEHAQQKDEVGNTESEAGDDPESFWRRENRSFREKQDPRIRVVMDYLNSHPSDMMNEDYLSEIAGISKSTLRRLFKQQSGKTLSDYVLELRMQTAARMLLISEKNVSDIAYEVGYSSPGYFTRMFRRFFGTSPNAYRKNARI